MPSVKLEIESHRASTALKNAIDFLVKILLLVLMECKESEGEAQSIRSCLIMMEIFNIISIIEEAQRVIAIPHDPRAKT